MKCKKKPARRRSQAALFKPAEQGFRGRDEARAHLAETARSEGYLMRITGDAVIGDDVVFMLSVFRGRRNGVAEWCYEIIRGIIVSESYSVDHQQHTFSLRLQDGRQLQIKGRHLYGVDVWAKQWTDPKARDAARDEKHERGSYIRAQGMKRRTKPGNAPHGRARSGETGE